MKRFSITGWVLAVLLNIGPNGVDLAMGKNLTELLEEKGIISDEDAQSVKKDGRPILSLRGGKVSLGGELELEFIKSDQNDAPDNNPYPRFAVDKFVLSPEVTFSEEITFHLDLESGPDKPIKVDEAWVKFSDLPFDTWVKVGLEDIFMKPHRKTESYPILGHAFWQDEDLGVYLGGESGEIYWRASVTNGRRLKDRKIQEDDVAPIPTDDDTNIEANGNKQVGVGLGIDHEFKEDHSVNILPFYYIASLSDDDVAYLQGISTYGVSEDDDQHRFGVNLEYILRAFNFFGQYMQATDGKMDRNGWYVQGSTKIKCKCGKTIMAHEFLIRYEDYNVDLSLDPADSRTWDRQTTTLAVITDVVKNLKVKTEYYFKNEDTGAGDLKNNELLVQLEAKF